MAHFYAFMYERMLLLGSNAEGGKADTPKPGNTQSHEDRHIHLHRLWYFQALLPQSSMSIACSICFEVKYLHVFIEHDQSKIALVTDDNLIGYVFDHRST